MKKFLLMIFPVLLFQLCAGESYNFLLLSDTHFGGADTYYNGPEKIYRTKKDIYRADKAMNNVTAMFDDMVKKSDEKTRFVIHCGDIIEGYTKNQETHEKVLRESFDLMNKYFSKLPLYFVKGNHEAVGLGGKEAWENVGLPELSKTVGKKLSNTCYSIRRGEDIFIFLDYSYKNHPEFLRETLAGLDFKPRYVFAIIHWEIVPLFLEQKQQICDILSPYNGIIIHGHFHRVLHLRYEKNNGRVITFSLGSFINPDLKKMRFIKIDNNLDNYAASFRRKAAGKKEAIRLLEQESLPFITHYAEYSSHNLWQGYGKIYVSDEGVFAELQSADLTDKPLKVELTKIKKLK